MANLDIVKNRNKNNIFHKDLWYLGINDIASYGRLFQFNTLYTLQQDEDRKNYFKMIFEGQPIDDYELEKIMETPEAQQLYSDYREQEREKNGPWLQWDNDGIYYGAYRNLNILGDKYNNDNDNDGPFILNDTNLPYIPGSGGNGSGIMEDNNDNDISSDIQATDSAYNQHTNALDKIRRNSLNMFVNAKNNLQSLIGQLQKTDNIDEVIDGDEVIDLGSDNDDSDDSSDDGGLSAEDRNQKKQLKEKYKKLENKTERFDKKIKQHRANGAYGMVTAYEKSIVEITEEMMEIDKKIQEIDEKKNQNKKDGNVSSKIIGDKNDDANGSGDEGGGRIIRTDSDYKEKPKNKDVIIQDRDDIDNIKENETLNNMKNNLNDGLKKIAKNKKMRKSALMLAFAYFVGGSIMNSNILGSIYKIYEYSKYGAGVYAFIKGAKKVNDIGIFKTSNKTQEEQPQNNGNNDGSDNSGGNNNKKDNKKDDWLSKGDKAFEIDFEKNTCRMYDDNGWTNYQEDDLFDLSGVADPEKAVPPKYKPFQKILNEAKKSLPDKKFDLSQFKKVTVIESEGVAKVVVDLTTGYTVVYTYDAVKDDIKQFFENHKSNGLGSGSGKDDDKKDNNNEKQDDNKKQDNDENKKIEDNNKEKEKEKPKPKKEKPKPKPKNNDNTKEKLDKVKEMPEPGKNKLPEAESRKTRKKIKNKDKDVLFEGGGGKKRKSVRDKKLDYLNKEKPKPVKPGGLPNPPNTKLPGMKNNKNKNKKLGLGPAPKPGGGDTGGNDKKPNEPFDFDKSIKDMEDEINKNKDVTDDDIDNLRNKLNQLNKNNKVSDKDKKLLEDKLNRLQAKNYIKKLDSDLKKEMKNRMGNLKDMFENLNMDGPTEQTQESFNLQRLKEARDDRNANVEKEDDEKAIEYNENMQVNDLTEDVKNKWDMDGDEPPKELTKEEKNLEELRKMRDNDDNESVISELSIVDEDIPQDENTQQKSRHKEMKQPEKKQPEKKQPDKKQNDHPDYDPNEYKDMEAEYDSDLEMDFDDIDTEQYRRIMDEYKKLDKGPAPAGTPKSIEWDRKIENLNEKFRRLERKIQSIGRNPREEYHQRRLRLGYEYDPNRVINVDYDEQKVKDNKPQIVYTDWDDDYSDTTQAPDIDEIDVVSVPTLSNIDNPEYYLGHQNLNTYKTYQEELRRIKHLEMDDYDHVLSLPTIDESLEQSRNIDTTEEQKVKQATSSLFAGGLDQINQLRSLATIDGLLDLMPAQPGRTIISGVSEINARGNAVPYHQSSVLRAGLVDDYDPDLAYSNELKEYRNIINDPSKQSNKDIQTLKNKYDSLTAVDRTLESMERAVKKDPTLAEDIKDTKLMNEAQKTKLLKEMEILKQNIEEAEILTQRPQVSQEMKLKQDLREIKEAIRLNPSLKNEYKDFISKHQKEWNEINIEDMENKKFYDNPMNKLKRDPEINKLQDQRERLYRKYTHRKTTPLKRKKYAFDLNKREAQLQEAAKKYVNRMSKEEREEFNEAYQRYKTAQEKIQKNQNNMKEKQRQENMAFAAKIRLRDAVSQIENNNEILLSIWADSLFGPYSGMKHFGQKAMGKLAKYIADYIKN